MGVFKIFKDIISGQKLPDISNSQLPDQDGEEETSNIGERVTGGETFVMQYCDSNGKTSVRRITVYTVKGDKLQTWCHERDAFRSFRIAGVQSLATLDGEVFENLEDMLPIPPTSKLAHSSETDPYLDPYYWVEDSHLKQFFVNWDQLLPELILLRTIARVDGFSHPEENIVMIEYATKRFAALGHELDEKQLAQTKRRIKSLYPDALDIEDAVPQLNTLTRDEIRDFLACCKQIVVADGKIMDSEIEIFNELGHAVIAEHKAFNALA